jgi:hypothetical protein
VGAVAFAGERFHACLAVLARLPETQTETVQKNTVVKNSILILYKTSVFLASFFYWCTKNQQAEAHCPGLSCFTVRQLTLAQL